MVAQPIFVCETRRLPVKRIFGVLMDEFRDHARPAGLVAGTQPCAGVAVEIFVEQDEIAPVGIGVESGTIAVRGPAERD